jgi:nucleoid-associated protein YgaU
MQDIPPSTASKQGDQEQPPGLATEKTVEGSIAASELVSTDPPAEPDIAKHSTVLLAPLTPPKRYVQVNWWSLVALAFLLMLVGEHAIPLLWPVLDNYLHPKATVTLFAARQPLTFRYSFLAVTGIADQSRQQVPSRMIAFTSPTKSVTIQTTGVGYTPAIQAHGTITFYNEANYPQTIDAGTVITGQNGIQIVTDQPVTVGAGNPPASYGIAETAAHTIQAGARGNIHPFALNGLCCLAGIYAKNRRAFTGGADPKPYPMLSNADLQREAADLAGALSTEAKVGTQSQLLDSEQFIQPMQCTVYTVSHPKVGERATEAQVSVSETCTAQVYDYAALREQVQAHFLQDAGRKAGSNFRQSGNLSVTLERTTPLDRKHTTYQLTVSAAGTMVFRLSAAELHTLGIQLAGKPIDQAQRELLQIQGVQGVDITPARQGDSVLPTDPSRIDTTVS